MNFQKGRFRKRLVGKNVEIRWNDPDYDWPSFRVLDVWPNRKVMRLKGIDDGNGGVHDGDDILVLFEEIAALEVME